jgi:hypothetical protein
MANPVKTIAGVATAPARAAGAAAAGTARSLRDWSGGNVDDWGCDSQAVARAFTASRTRWDVAVGGTEHIPRRGGGALIVVNARSLSLAPVFAALAIGDAVGRPVRFVGRPDIAPIGPLLQRLGGLLPIEDELEGALRAGELVLLGAAHRRDNARSGTIDHRLVGAAVAARVRVLPAVALSAPLSRAARVEIGAPVARTRIRRGPLAELELADALQRRIDELLVEFGGPLTGTVLDWIPGAGLLRGAFA